MATEEDKGKIDQLRERLYSRENPASGYQHGELKPEKYDVAKDWQKSERPMAARPRKSKRGSFLNKVLAFSVLFFLLALGYAYLAFNGGFNTISSDHIDVDIDGPSSVSAGDPIELRISIHNKNAVALKDANLLVEYPTGTRRPDDVSQELRRDSADIGVIAEDGEVQETVRAVLYGQVGDVEKINLHLEYGVPNSNAVFTKDTVYEIKINKAPLTVSVDTIKEVSPGQQVSFKITLGANSTEPVENVLLNAEYPFGFTYTSSSVEPIKGDTTWQIGDLAEGSKREITINGTLYGQPDEERVFVFTVGVAGSKDSQSILVPFLTDKEEIAIRQPFLGLNLSLNGLANQGALVTKVGQPISGTISWRNDTNDRIIDAEVKATISGGVVNPTAIVSQDGFYDSSTGTIVWSQRTDPLLDAISAGESGESAFSIGQKPLADVAGTVVNPTITIGLVMTGTRLSSSGEAQYVESRQDKSIKVASNLMVSATGFHVGGPFENHGPLPPRVGDTTTYTIILNLSNSFNEVNGAVVTATLPPYLDWLGTVAPAGASVSYNPVSGQVRWSAGTVPAGTGFGTTPAAQVAFQVGFKPSLSQINQEPALLEALHASGSDTFTNLTLDSDGQIITTRLDKDPNFPGGGGKVIQ
jgi:hypothetical protein